MTVPCGRGGALTFTCPLWTAPATWLTVGGSLVGCGVGEVTGGAAMPHGGGRFGLCDAGGQGLPLLPVPWLPLLPLFAEAGPATRPSAPAASTAASARPRKFAALPQ